MIYIFILKLQITKNWVPSILFRKNRKKRRIHGKTAKITKTVQYKKINLDFRDQGKKLN